MLLGKGVEEDIANTEINKAPEGALLFVTFSLIYLEAPHASYLSCVA